MKLAKLKSIIYAVLITSISFTQISYSENLKSEKYEATWNSLRGHSTPNWLEDAKFGIYCHWGVWTVQYAMGYKEGGDKLELDEAITRFTAENFDPKEWAHLFKSAGAKFGGPVAWHGTKYLHWNSQLTDYSSVKMSPHRDIVGELEKEIRDAGLKFLISYHYRIYQDGWIDFAKEGVDLYSPDLFWLDASFGATKGAQHHKIVDRSHYTGEGSTFLPSLPDHLQREFISHYFNHAVKENKEVELLYKSHDIPPGVGMRDIENGILDHIAYDTWMTDIDMNICPDWSVHGWFYREGIPLRSTNNLIDLLVDIVSKNGVLLLNVPPMADGSFGDEVTTNLKGVGDWLKVNGEAIYAAFPWFIHGEGPTLVDSKNNTFHHNDNFAETHFTDKDIRFTVNGSNLYAICLGKPSDSLTIRSLTTNWRVQKGQILDVSLVGSEKNLIWKHNEKGLILDLKEHGLNDHANVFRVKLIQ